MYEAVIATGGTFVSICATDWATPLAAALGDVSRALDSFSLEQEAVPGTLVVRVDGVNVTSGWSYDADRNALTFDADHVPEGGSSVEVSYAVRGECG
ncbi:MAG: hypothetical protein ABIO70_07540 [Pseudomonadota bacterium]